MSLKTKNITLLSDAHLSGNRELLRWALQEELRERAREFMRKYLRALSIDELMELEKESFVPMALAPRPSAPAEVKVRGKRIK